MNRMILEYQPLNNYISLNKWSSNTIEMIMQHYNIIFIYIEIWNMTKIYLFLELQEYLKEIWGEDSMKVVQQASLMANKGLRELCSLLLVMIIIIWLWALPWQNNFVMRERVEIITLDNFGKVMHVLLRKFLNCTISLEDLDVKHIGIIKISRTGTCKWA